MTPPQTHLCVHPIEGRHRLLVIQSTVAVLIVAIICVSFYGNGHNIIDLINVYNDATRLFAVRVLTICHLDAYVSHAGKEC